jgi:hypothetical protein
MPNELNHNARGDDGHNRNWQRLGNFVNDEVPTPDAVLTTTLFTLANPPREGTLKLLKNGLRLRLTTDYTVAYDATTKVFSITLLVALAPGDWLVADYRY